MVAAWFRHGFGRVLAGSGMVVTCFHWETLWIKFACLLHWNDAGMVSEECCVGIGRIFGGSGLVVTCFDWETIWIKFACLLHWYDSGLISEERRVGLPV